MVLPFLLLLVAAADASAASLAAPLAASPAMIEDFKAEDAAIYSREFKKVEISARVVLAPGAPEPKLNLVQVSESGEKIRFLGIMLRNPKKNDRWTRKVELLEREAGLLYFEIVPESELEPFQKQPRPRAVVEVLKRPSLIEIIDGVFHKFRGGSGASRTGASAGDCPDQPGLTSADFKPLEAPGLPQGMRGYSGVRRINGKEAGSLAALMVVVQRPLQQVLDVLWDPANLKDPGRVKLRVEADGPALKRVGVEAKPLFFITLNWTELWERSASRIRYHKTEGDGRLKHFCGWMEATSAPENPGSSALVLYEEVEATGRSPEDVLEGHVGTVRKILTTQAGTQSVK